MSLAVVYIRQIDVFVCLIDQISDMLNATSSKKLLLEDFIFQQDIHEDFKLCNGLHEVQILIPWNTYGTW